MTQRLTVAFGVMLLLASVSATQDRNTFRVETAGAAGEGRVVRIESKDGTPIAVECAGSGPTLVMVHGGIGDRTRWTPMIPLLKSHFTACAMDRRGHGASGDSSGYSLRKEAEDIAAVVDSQPGTVYLLGHSYGGVAALEAALLVGARGFEPPTSRSRTKRGRKT